MGWLILQWTASSLEKREKERNKHATWDSEDTPREGSTENEQN